MKSYTIHVELREAMPDDYSRLIAAMIKQGFLHINNGAVSGADFSYQDHLSLESVLYKAQAAVLETGKHFSISVNEIGGKGVGAVG